ncbi:MAG: hypothetical protein IJV37_02360 [Bacteroidales bacterium]|nr:hypothetical protein [Bacteroidales bacterium]
MKKPVRYAIGIVLILMFCIGTGFLFRHVRQEQSSLVCGTLAVHFADSLRFVNEEDVRNYLDANYGPYIGERLDSVQLYRIEALLESHSSVIRSEAWTTGDGVLHIDITQRAPVLRFQNGQNGFYVDGQGFIFPLHDSFTASVPVVEGAIPVDLPAGYKGEAPDDFSRRWIGGVLEMNRIVSQSRSWQRSIKHVRVRPNGDLLLTLDGRSEEFIVGQPEGIADKLTRIDRYLGLIAPSRPEGYYRTVNVKYNQQIICRQKDT